MERVDSDRDPHSASKPLAGALCELSWGSGPGLSRVAQLDRSMTAQGSPSLRMDTLESALVAEQAIIRRILDRFI